MRLPRLPPTGIGHGPTETSDAAEILQAELERGDSRPVRHLVEEQRYSLGLLRRLA